MSAHSQSRGHALIWDDKRHAWVQPASGEYCAADWKCKHCGKNPDRLWVMVPADLSHCTVAYLKPCGIDACIAPIVKALNGGGIPTIACCCGHGKQNGSIILCDGRELKVHEKEETKSQTQSEAAGEEKGESQAKA